MKANEQGRYVIINTLLNTSESTLVDQLNGRIGDSGRIVYFALKDGQLPHNLIGQDVFIRVKDANGKVKQVTGIADKVSATAGLFSMYIPSEFYQASGDVEEAYMAVTNDKGDLISSVPLSFKVIENNMLITANGSRDYIDQIDEFVKNMQKKISDLGNSVEATNASYVSLKDALSVYLDTINKNGVAVLGSQNHFTDKNIFDQKIEGSITHATNADSATNADKAVLASRALVANNTTDDTGWLDQSDKFMSGAKGTAKIRKKNGIVQLIIQAVTGYYEGNTLPGGNQLIKLPWKGGGGSSNYPGEYTFNYNGAPASFVIADDILKVHWVASPSKDPNIHLYASIMYIAN